MLLKDYLQEKQISVSRAAREISCSREWLYQHFNGKPLGYRLARRVKNWSRGRVRLRDSMMLDS